MTTFRRKDPHHEIYDLSGKPVLVFLTLATNPPGDAWLATADVHARLHRVWQEATAWRVSNYLLMPDHLHLFAFPGEADYPFRRWMSYWKRRFTQSGGEIRHAFQSDYWDVTVRSSTYFTEKQVYMWENPVRKGLVTTPEEWPFKGTVHPFVWMEH